MKIIKANILSLILLVTMVIFNIGYFEKLPDSIAIKYDFSGAPRLYTVKEFAVILMPLVFVILIGGINFLVKISPHKFSMPQSKRAMDITIFGSGLLLFGINLGILLDGGSKEIFTRFFSFGIALFLIVVGNVFGKTERNFFMGIRVPWTLATEANWKATHRFTGKLMVAFGVVLFAVSFIYLNLALAVTSVLAPALLPVYYSYRFYVTKERIKEKTES